MTKNENEMIKEKIRSLYASQKLGVLATCGKAGPYANLISFAASTDLTAIVFTTPRETHKFTNMQEDNRVALLVENSQNSLEDFTNAVAVTATGTVFELTGEKRQARMARYLEKHPNLETFVNSRGSALMEIIVDTYVLVENFQTVTRLQVGNS